MSNRGQFITFEGGEGSGKTTQLQRLADFIREQNIDVITTREPGGAPSAEVIRTLLVEGATDRWQPVTEVLLHSAARAEHLANTVLPALEQGTWVISDRFTDSTVAYQGYAHGFDLERISQIQHATIGDMKPNLTIMLDIPVQQGLARAHGRAGGEDRYERMGEDFHERVRDGFLSIAKAEPERCHIINADQPLDKVSQDLIAFMTQYLNTKQEA